MLKRMPVAALLLSVASACAPINVETDVCEPWEPALRFSAPTLDAMDGEDLRQLDAYYGTGERLCGWTP